jgi:phosphoribosylformylglycinamidine cyclo-ligase
MTTDARPAYTRAGVDVGAGELAVELLRQRIGPTVDIVGRRSAFAAALPLTLDGRREPVLVAATDGVGTKTEIARRMRRYDTIGQDLVAMCVDDVVCLGAKPEWLLDYLAVGRVDPERVATIVDGIARACRGHCQLVGGETAEHPGLMEPDAFDLAGFCIGLVDAAGLIDGRSAMEGDVVFGLASSGLHANGYSLVRAVLDEHGLDLRTPFRGLVARHLGPDAADAVPDDGATLGDALLTPTRIYAWDIEAMLETLRDRSLRIAGLAHVTGGGLRANLPRAVPDHLAVEVDPSGWPVPPVVALVAGLAGLPGSELRATFNGGIGMAIVVEPAAAATVTELLSKRSLEGWPIGTVIPASRTGAVRYREVDG